MKPDHYNNDKGSLYKFSEDNNLNAYEFDIIKRVLRCRHKGEFLKDINKSIFLLQLYESEIKEPGIVTKNLVNLYEYFKKKDVNINEYIIIRRVFELRTFTDFKYSINRIIELLKYYRYARV